MSSNCIRPLMGNSGTVGEVPFYANCLAWLLFLNGYALDDSTPGQDFLNSESNGVDGEFNLTGTDYQFRDTVASAFTGSLDKWLVIQDTTNPKNVGIYKITSVVSATTVVLDFRCGLGEYPVQATGLQWWLASSATAAATGAWAAVDAESLSDGLQVVVDGGGIGANTRLVVEYWRTYVSNWHNCPPIPDPAPAANPYTPLGTRYGSLISVNRFNKNNTLSGKTLTFSWIGPKASSMAVTFTGINPIPITDVIDQINTPLIALGLMFPGFLAYRSDQLGYSCHSEWFSIGEPDSAGSANCPTIIYASSSEVWSDLGFTGTSNITAATLPHITGIWNNSDCGGDLAAALAAPVRSRLNGFGNLSSGGTGANVTWSNTKAGCHGNRIGSSGGVMSMWGYGHFTHPVSGVSVQIGVTNLTNPVLEISVALDGNWLGPKVLGPVYFGTVFGKINWLHAEGDTAGTHLNVLLHQITMENTGDSITAGSPCTLAKAGAGFSTLVNSKTIVISGCNNPGNNGSFTVTYLSPTQVTYTNPSAVSETSSFRWGIENKYNGAMFGPVIPFDAGHAAEELFALMGNTSYSSGDYSGNCFVRSYNSLCVGHGFAWDGITSRVRDVYMVEPSYSGYASSLSKWTSRERNRRRSGGPLPSVGDSIAAGSPCTLTKTGAGFTAADTGKTIRIRGCSNPGNNGVFVVTYLSATQVTYTNASAMNETSLFNWSMDHQDILEGTVLIMDELNTNNRFEFLGRLLGHYSVRSGTTGYWSALKAFDDSGYLDKYHLNDGIAIMWPGLATQHP